MTTHKVLLNKLNVPLALQILLLAHLQNLMLDLLSQSTPRLDQSSGPFPHLIESNLKNSQCDMREL